MNMKTAFFSLLAVGALTGGGVVTANLIAPVSAAAQTTSAKAIVDKAISNGVVGETAAGYLALTSGTASAQITNAMNEVNIGRKSLYTSKARAEGISVDQLAALFGEKQLAKAKPGEKVLTREGRWVTVR